MIAACAALSAQLIPHLKIAGSQDSSVNLWFTDNGERAGTFNGHNGAVWTCDISCAPARRRRRARGWVPCSKRSPKRSVLP